MEGQADAAPHVGVERRERGVCAQYRPTDVAVEPWKKLRRRRLFLSARDLGSGLVPKPAAALDKDGFFLQ